MSKVKEFYGKKEKARHQLRRYETRHKKITRANKYRDNIYMWCKGFYVRDEREHYRYDKTYVPAHDEEVEYFDWKTMSNVKRVRHYPARTYRKLVETTTQKIFHVKQAKTDMKYYKKFAAKHFRRNKNFDEENYEVLKGSKYKRDYEVLWNLW